jgi:hypothetical protein
MAKRSITIELDDETLRDLAVLGEPLKVLAHLAYSAADGVRRPGHPKREQTNESLQVERDKSDIAIATERAAVEEQADDVFSARQEWSAPALEERSTLGS